MEIVQTFLASLKKAKIKVLLVFYLALSSDPLFKIQIGFGQNGHFLQEMKPIKKRFAKKDIRMETCIEKGSNDILWNAVTKATNNLGPLHVKVNKKKISQQEKIS